MAKRTSDFTERSVAIRHGEAFGSRGKPDHDLERGVIRDRPAARQAITSLLSPTQVERSATIPPRATAKEPRGRRIGRDSLPPERTASLPQPAEKHLAAPDTATNFEGQSWPLASAAALGAIVRQQRQSLGFSQQRLADLAGVGRRFVSELETGKSTLEFDRVVTCCAALGIDLFARNRS